MRTSHIRPWCEAHAKQERVLYHFLKHADKHYDILKEPGDTEDMERNEAVITLLYYALVVRTAHGEWFFPDSKCQGHSTLEMILIGRRAAARNALYYMQFAIHTKTPDNLLQEIMKRVFITMPTIPSLNFLRETTETAEEYALLQQEGTQTCREKSLDI
ncbi:hypothetical protein PG996_010539 [Apiospora saccharicola]|uniref:Uncharacterized protein n=1 Tax=Apiospora saccharicola TaxID=335842 RepID=A0ABR1UNW4_9PEZI